MPFIDNELEIHTDTPHPTLLFTSLRGSLDSHISFDYAQYLANQGLNVLWVDGNLGISESKKINPAIDKILNDKAAIPKAIRKIKNVNVLVGRGNHPLIHHNLRFKNQFLTDLRIVSLHYDITIIFIPYHLGQLKDLWSDWADQCYLIFQNDGLNLEKLTEILQNSKTQFHGLISTGKNPHETRLAWLRLQQTISNLPPLITDTKKIAP